MDVYTLVFGNLSMFRDVAKHAYYNTTLRKVLIMTTFVQKCEFGSPFSLKRSILTEFLKVFSMQIYI